MPLENIAPRTIGEVSTESLEFDPENPRLLEDGIKNPSDEQIIRALADTADLEEVVQSIAANGYWNIEPLIGINTGKKWRILEGNRRLAAIRLLKKQIVVKELGFNIPEISPKNRATLDTVSVYAVENKNQAREYIGFKHINGPHKWDSWAKARYAADWFKNEKGRVTIDQIARQLGDNHSTVARLVNGVLVLDQASESKIFEITDRYPGRKFAFSHLYTALTRPGYRDFLGMDEEWRVDDLKPNPVPKSHLENLRLVLQWLYGSKSDQIKPVIQSQNPDIKNLAAVLGNSRARTIMMSRNNLNEAFSAIEPKGARFESALINAKQEAESAISQIIGYAGDLTLFEIGRDLKETSAKIYLLMKTKVEERSPKAKK